jgi:hypothetical protein
MGARESLQRLADRKSQEIADLERQIDMARSYLQAIQDSIKALPKESAPQGNTDDSPSELRVGSLLAKARDAIQKKGAPMHISEILSAIGVQNTKNTRVSLVGSLGSYVRKGQVFTRPGPNIFGLLGMKMPESVIPEGFGKLTDSV